MQLNRCPICHSRIGLDALAQDDAGRELLGLLAKLDTDAGSALVGYLGLFRSHTRDLANDRALKLAREALSLGPTGSVAQAMRQTVEQIQAKWSTNVPYNGDIPAIPGGRKPLSNHNYLKRVLEDTGAVGAALAANVAADTHAGTRAAPTRINSANKGVSKTAQALQALEDFGNGQ